MNIQFTTIIPSVFIHKKHAVPLSVISLLKTLSYSTEDECPIDTVASVLSDLIRHGKQKCLGILKL